MNKVELIFCILAAAIYNTVAAPMLTLPVPDDDGNTGDFMETVYASSNLHVNEFGLTSELGTRTHVRKEGDGITRESDAHLYHNVMGSRDGLAQSEINVAKVGVRDYHGDGFGIGAEATLAEIRGKFGKGPVSVGAKIGLSADTGISVGKKTELKVLGTGFGFDLEDGLSVCLFGSCLSIG